MTRTEDFTITPTIDDVWCRRFGLFEWANLFSEFPMGGLMPRGAWPELFAELERWPCFRCERVTVECGCHERGEL